jgi:hypothetical protein
MDFKSSYYTLWQKSPEIQGSSVTQFSAGVDFDHRRINHFTNLLHGARFWPVDVSRARTVNPITETDLPGQWTDPTKFICGYFVVRGDLEAAMSKSQHIDRSFAAPYIESLTAEGLDDLNAHATSTFAAVSDIDATVMTVWANKTEGPPRMPTDLAIGAITAYNAWGRHLHENRDLLDAGRMNVSTGASHVTASAVKDGPWAGDRLIGIGSYANGSPSPAKAVEESGLVAHDSSLTISLQACNGWCLAMTPSPEHDDPRSSIFV